MAIWDLGTFEVTYNDESKNYKVREELEQNVSLFASIEDLLGWLEDELNEVNQQIITKLEQQKQQ